MFSVENGSEHSQYFSKNKNFNQFTFFSINFLLNGIDSFPRKWDLDTEKVVCKNSFRRESDVRFPLIPCEQKHPQWFICFVPKNYGKNNLFYPYQYWIYEFRSSFPFPGGRYFNLFFVPRDSEVIRSVPSISHILILTPILRTDSTLFLGQLVFTFKLAHIWKRKKCKFDLLSELLIGSISRKFRWWDQSAVMS
jgi:hypothetical protein